VSQGNGDDLHSQNGCDSLISFSNAFSSLRLRVKPPRFHVCQFRCCFFKGRLLTLASRCLLRSSNSARCFSSNADVMLMGQPLLRSVVLMSVVKLPPTEAGFSHCGHFAAQFPNHLREYARLSAQAGWYIIQLHIVGRELTVHLNPSSVQHLVANFFPKVFMLFDPHRTLSTTLRLLTCCAWCRTSYLRRPSSVEGNHQQTWQSASSLSCQDQQDDL
jgi:hypothetical protein